MILVVYNSRSGSKFFQKQLALKHGYEVNPIKGEPFNERRPLEIIEENIRMVREKKDIVVKLSYPQWTDATERTGVDILQLCLDRAEEVYFLVREDYNAQLRSLFVANYFQNWDDTSWKKKKVVCYNRRRYHSNEIYLRESYTEHSKLFHSLTNKKLVVSESFMTVEGKVHRPVLWDEPPPEFDFKPLSLFL